MKRFTIFVIILSCTLLTACASSASTADQAGSAPSLIVSGGEISKTFTRADLEKLSVTEAVFKDVTYKGVTISALITEAGFDPATVKAIKAVASDGFAVNYDPGQVMVDEVIVAYARADGDLTADDGSFRMVLPGAEGKLNVRMMVELQVIQ